MAKNSDLDRAAQKIADVRVECVKLGVAPAEIAKIMLDEAVLGLMASGHSLDDIQAAFKKYIKRDLVRFYQDLVKAALGKGFVPATLMEKFTGSLTKFTKPILEVRIGVLPDDGKRFVEVGYPVEWQRIGTDLKEGLQRLA